MVRVFFINNWGDSKEQWLERMTIQKPDNFKSFEISLDIKKSDYVVIFDDIGQQYKKEFFNTQAKIIFVQREPEHVSKINTKLLQSCDFSYLYEDGFVAFAAWWLDYNHSELIKIPYSKKDKHLSCITTLKNSTIIQKRRVEWLRQIQNKIEIDFYGKAAVQQVFKNYKGPPERPYLFTSNKNRDKSVLMEYQKSLSFDNGSRKNFVTRIVEPLLCWTLPIYYGCPNLNQIIPQNSFREIDINKQIDSETIQKICEPISTDEIAAMTEARMFILNKMNFWNSMETILNNIGAL